MTTLNSKKILLSMASAAAIFVGGITNGFAGSPASAYYTSSSPTAIAVLADESVTFPTGFIWTPPTQTQAAPTTWTLPKNGTFLFNDVANPADYTNGTIAFAPGVTNPTYRVIITNSSSNAVMPVFPAACTLIVQTLVDAELTLASHNTTLEIEGPGELTTAGVFTTTIKKLNTSLVAADNTWTATLQATGPRARIA